MKRAAIVGAMIVAGIFAAVWISTSENHTPKNSPPVQLRDPFRPDHPTRAQRDAERSGASAPAGAVDNKKAR